MRLIIPASVTVACTLAFGAAMPAPAAAQALHKQLIEVATREFLPPYVEAGASTGIEIDLINAILKPTRYEAVYVQQPRVRMIAAFENRELDGILTQNEKASNVGCATDWYIAHQNVAISLHERNITIQGMADLKNYSVLSFSGATRYLGDKFQEAVLGAKRYTESGDQGTHISLLYKNRFDVVVGDRWILKLAQKRHFEKYGDYKELDTHPIMMPSLYVARFHDRDICEAFNQSLRTMRASGAYAEIWAGYQAKLVVSSVMDPAPLP